MDTTTLPEHTLVGGRYRTGALLGTGGMGHVYEATDERLDRPVAVKLVRTTDPTAAARLRAEANVLASLRHPNVVAVFDAGEHDGRGFVVTELVHGRSLRSRMDEGPLGTDEVARIGSQVASALVCAHGHHVVHRDLTPGNVLLVDGTDDARLIDFGIAVSEHASGLTATGTVIGTPAYLSPEQVEGRTATGASDVYALGLVLLEAQRGEKVFPGTPAASAVARLLGDAPVPDDLPPGWGPLLAAMTRRDPALRPDAAEVADRLDGLGGPGGPAHPSDDRTLITPSGGAATPADERTLITPSGRTAPPTGDRTLALALPWSPTPAPPSPPPTTDHHRRRWPLVLAGAALLAGLVVLLAFGLGAGGDTGPGVDPPTSAAPAAPASGPTASPTTVAAASTGNGQSPKGSTTVPSAPSNQGKVKGKGGHSG
jgi:serine/threonine protein kinase